MGGVVAVVTEGPEVTVDIGNRSIQGVSVGRLCRHPLLAESCDDPFVPAYDEQSERLSGALSGLRAAPGPS